VGGIVEKIYGAIRAGMNKVIIPYDNRSDVPENIKEIEVVIVKNIEEVLNEIEI
jgi:ATP-dependent Lon protease